MATEDTLDCPQFGGKCIFYPHENSNCTCRTVTWELMPEYRTEATLVERLRDQRRFNCDLTIQAEAADEIERLRAELAEVRHKANNALPGDSDENIDALVAEIEAR